MKQEPAKFEVTYRGRPYEAIFSVVSGRVLVSVRLEKHLWSQACACSNGDPSHTARQMAWQILARAGEAEALEVRLRRARSLAD